MNIQEAKDFVKNAVTAYLDKDAGGSYVVPRARQRPLIVMGAPGLGKTAIVSQVAAELGIGYVGYAMTHHTRQSAIGLPIVGSGTYGGEEVPVTRYTMSEIVASVYDAMESQGRREGILFIDEVNCVSETLSAAMLDLLQNKKFGPHRIPDGWVLVAAGNPPEYNASAREFDIATLDRVRLIDVEPDADVWLRYAESAGVHDAVTYYLRVKPRSLLSVESTPSGPVFATPRGWEDLSTMLKEHERLGLPADTGLISQYIRDPDIAAEFKRYLDFHRRYKEEYDVDSILEGASSSGESLARAGAEEKLSVISVMVGSLNAEAEEGMGLKALARVAEGLDPEDPKTSLESAESEIRRTLLANGTPDAQKTAAFCLSALSGAQRTREGVEALAAEAGRKLEGARKDFDRRMENAMSFMTSVFGRGQEPVSLLSALLGCYNVVMFSEPGGPLYRYNDELFEADGDLEAALEELT